MVLGRSGPSLRERFGISWRIVRQSFDLLGRERDLWILPILSGTAMMIAFGLIFLGTDLFGNAPSIADGLVPMIGHYALIGLYMLPPTFATIFLNAALADAVYHRLGGEDRSIREALGSATDRIVPIAVFAIISAVVGAILSVVGQVTSKLQVIPGLGRIVQAAGAFAWAVATYFVLPILVIDREPSVVSAIGDSKEIAKEHWGESVGGIVTVGLVLMVPVMVVMLVGVFGAIWLGVAGAVTFETAMTLLLVAMIGGMALSMVLGSALNTTYQTALFMYTRTGEAASPFTEGTLDEAWEPYREG